MSSSLIQHSWMRDKNPLLKRGKWIQFFFGYATIHLQCSLIKRLRYLLNYLFSLIELALSYCSLCLHDGRYKLSVKCVQGILHSPFQRSSSITWQKWCIVLMIFDERICKFSNERYLFLYLYSWLLQNFSQK